MLKLIIVDDEEIVLRGIQKVFQLKAYGFKIVGVFNNPLKALEQMRQLSPDLIITDIKMPQMDGLEFAMSAKQVLPSVEIVVLSGYDDFSYAQTAMKLGISDYLLKPIRKGDFEAMIETMQKKIVEKTERDWLLEHFKSITTTSYSTLRNKFFLSLAERDCFNEPEMQSLYHQLGFSFNEKRYTLIKFVIYEMQSKDDYMSHLEALIKAFKQRLIGIGYVEEFYTDEYLYFFLYDTNECVWHPENLIKIVTDFVTENGAEGIKLHAGISACHHNLSEFIFSVAECDEDILTKDSQSKEISTFYKYNNRILFPYVEMENLFTLIHSNDSKDLGQLIDKIFELPENIISKDVCYSIALIILVRMSHIQNKYGAENAIIPLALLDIKQLSKSYPSLLSLKKLIQNKAGELMAIIHAQENSPASKTISDALRYIESHYQTNISLSEVSDHIYISKNYLCDLFKKELNTTFIDYVTNLRIGKAKELLANTDMKMYEISEKVGYKDYAYFSQVFKRHTGTTLSKYRKKH